MECPRCRFDNPPGFRFCGQCGGRLPIGCPRCGAPVPAEFRFCGQCGAPVAEAPPAEPASSAAAPAAAEPAPPPGAPEPESSGEIKQVTVLCCALADTGDRPAEPEARHDAFGLLIEAARVEVGRYEGSIGQLLPQGLLALFGAPVAHEDHPQRAVLAALGLGRRLAEALAGLAERGARFSARIGLDSGPVVVGGAGAVAVGETTDLAQRLAAAAEPGTIVIGARTRAAIGSGFRLSPAAGGVPDGLEAWRVEAAPEGAPAPARSRSHRKTPFVGRARELATLDELRQLAESGDGQAALLVGEAGAGKSRLLREFHATLEGRPMSLLRGHCLSYARGVPNLPFVEIVRRSCGVRDADPPEVTAAKLRETLDQLGVEPAGCLPYLLHLVGVSLGTEELEEDEPQALQERTFAAMRRMILAAAARSLVVLEIEDLHWIDPTSEEFLASLVEAMPAARILLLTTYRTGYQPSWLDKSYCTQVNLRRLSDRDSQTLLVHLLGDSEHGAELSGDILERAGGNPFFLEELAYSVTESGGAAGYSVPGSLQAVLMARLDRLPRAHKRLLLTASVFAQEITLRTLAELWDGPEAPAALIEDLLHQEFLVPVPEEDEPAYLFRHALTREVAYQSLLGRRRRELHARAAEALERLHAGRLEEVYDLLIHHYPRAGKPERTVHYLTLFAARAARGYSHAEAARTLRQALEHARELPEEIRDRRLVEVLLRLAESLLPLAGFAETLSRFEEHREPVERLGDPALTAQYHFWLAHTHTYLGHGDETARHAAAAIAAAREAGDETAEGKTCYVLGREGFWTGRYADGIENSLRAVVLLERTGEPWWQGQAYWVAGFNHFALGRFDAALEALERARDIGDALADYRLDSSWSIGFVYATLGRFPEAVEHCRRGLERARDPLNTAVATGFLGHALLGRGDLAAAAEHLDASIRRLREAGMTQLRSWFASFLAETHRRAGRPDQAAEAAEEGLAAAEEAEFGYGAALARRELGRSHHAAARLDRAAELLAAALEAFEGLEMPFEAALTRLDLARLAQDRGDPEAVERETAAARRGFEALGLADQVERVDLLAAELSGSAAPG